METGKCRPGPGARRATITTPRTSAITAAVPRKTGLSWPGRLSLDFIAVVARSDRRARIRLPAGPRRCARPGGGVRARVPSRTAVGVRWLFGRFGLLHPFRLLDHVAAAARARHARASERE